MKGIRKSSAVAGLLSFLPGLGQVYIGYYINGFVHLLVFAGTIATLNSLHHGDGLEPLLAIFLAFFWFFSVIDAVRKAQAYNLYSMGEEQEALPTDSPLVGAVVLLLTGVLFTLKVTFGLEMEWLGKVWPLAMLIGGAYLLWKYRRARRELRTGGKGWNSPRHRGEVPAETPIVSGTAIVAADGESGHREVS